MCITRISVRKSRPPTRHPTRSCARSSTTIASNTERASCESTRAQAPAAVEYKSRLVRIGRPRAQGRRPPPNAGTGTRAFNTPAMFSPNPTVTGSVIGDRHPSCRSFCSLSHQTSQGMTERREWVGTSSQGPLETPKVSVLAGEVLHGTRPSSRHVSFLEKDWETIDNTLTAPA